MIRKVFTNLILAISLLALAACESHSPSRTQPGFNRVNITLNAPIGIGKDTPLLAGGQQARFTADVTGVNGPFNISWNFGGAAEHAASSLAVQGTSTVDVELLRISGEQTYTATATVVDGAGVSQSDSINFNVLGWHNDPPVIESVDFGAGVLSVTASDVDDDTLSFSGMFLINSEDIGPPDYINGNTASWDLSDPLGPVVNPNEILAGGSFFGGIEVTVSDEYGASTQSVELRDRWEALLLEDDTLYAIATKGVAKVGEPVSVIVATGLTAAPFQYLSITVACENGAEMNWGSGDVGIPDNDDVPDQPYDGIWTDLNSGKLVFSQPSRGGFMPVFNWGDGPHYPFSMRIHEGAPLAGSGILFNYEYIFNQPGIYQLTLLEEESNVVTYPATYYRNSVNGQEIFWSDIDNDHPYNTIVVEE